MQILSGLKSRIADASDSRRFINTFDLAILLRQIKKYFRQLNYGLKISVTGAVCNAGGCRAESGFFFAQICSFDIIT
jgi:hypothetical protein